MAIFTPINQLNCFICDKSMKPNCADLVFGQAIYEHMQKQERANKILIFDYVVVSVSFFYALLAQ